nr:hypothetical protein CFP56_24288 [Quercus suber]
MNPKSTAYVNTNCYSGSLLCRDLEPLRAVPFLLPAREERMLVKRMRLPVLLDQAARQLLALKSLQRGHDHVLRMPGVLVLHESLLAFAEVLEHQGRDVGLVAELGDGVEQSLEIEHDGGGQREATQGLPVDAQMAAVEGVGGILGVAEVHVGIAGRHEERGVDLEAPGAALDGLLDRLLGEVARHGQGHLARVVGHRRVDRVQAPADLRAHVPPQRAADHPRPETVLPRDRVAQHDREVFGDVLQDDVQGRRGAEAGGGVQDGVVEGHVLAVDAEEPRVPGLVELYTHLHEFFGSGLRARQSLEDERAMFLEECYALADTLCVGRFDF